MSPVYGRSRLYVDDLQVMNSSERTIGHQDLTLNQFNTWCEERAIVRAGEITKPILERYRRHLHHSRDRRGNPFSAKKQLARLIPIRGFFKRYKRQNYLTTTILMLEHVSIGTTEIYTHVSIVKLKQNHEMTGPTLHQKQVEEGEPGAREEELLATLEAESSEED